MNCECKNEDGICTAGCGKHRKCDLEAKDICEWFNDELQCISQEDVYKSQSPFGNNYFKITPEQLEHLKSGGILYNLDEYGTFIMLQKMDGDTK